MEKRGHKLREKQHIKTPLGLTDNNVLFNLATFIQNLM